jgi:hypothetical protein
MMFNGRRRRQRDALVADKSGTGIVLQLQELAADGQSSVSELLRKARMVASKLKLKDFNAWVEHELHGYPADAKVPDYRVIDGDLRARNPMNGVLMPIRFNAELTEAISRIECRQGIGSLDELLASHSDNIQVALSPRELEFVHGLMDEFHQQWVIPFRRVSQIQVATIIDRVRSIILDWALELESKGIVGNGMTFSQDEQRRAVEQHVHIGTFQGILGDVNQSSVSQQLEMKVSRNDFEGLRSLLLGLDIPTAEIEGLRAALKADPPPEEKSHFGKRVSEWIGAVTVKLAGGACKVGLDVAIDRISHGIWQYYGF